MGRTLPVPPDPKTRPLHRQLGRQTGRLMDPMPGGNRAARLRRGFRMVKAMVALHPRIFAAAVVGAAVFATCTVLSGVALRWVIDRVFVPRFDNGHVQSTTVAAGIAFVFVVGVVRS